MDLCFMCTKDYHCVPVDDRIVSEVEYLIPEITIIKLGIPLRICSVCEGALDAFSKFKHSSVESSRRLESSIRAGGAPGPSLHTGRAPVVGHNDTSDTQPEKIEEMYIKEEPVEETWPECHPHINSTSLNPALRVDRTSPHVQLRALHTDISIKEDQLEETPQDWEFFNNIKKNICKEENAESNKMSDDKDNEREHKTDAKEYQCVVCGKIFSKKSYLRLHMKVHSATREYQCDACSKSFKHSGNLRTHMNTHSGIKKYQCNVCSKSFTQKWNLNAHMRIHLGMELHKCNICFKSFTQKHILNIHMKIHFDIKDHHCNVCNKSFIQKIDLQRHMKTHSDTKDQHCDVCNKSFRLKSHLKRHMKIHSKKK